MIKLLILSLVIFSSFTLIAKDCGPEIKEGKNVLMTMVECEKGQADCLELKDTAGVFSKLNPASKMYFKIKSAGFRDNLILLTMDAASACRFEEITSKNIGKQLAIVHKDIILTNPVIQSSIAGPDFQITGSGKGDFNLALCKSIFSGCVFEKPKKEPKPRKGSYLDKVMNPPDINRKEVNARYGSVMESYYWVTDQKSFEVFEDSTLAKAITIYTVPMTAEKNKKSIPFFYGVQEFDLKAKKFTYVPGAVKLRDIGWIKREDVVPLNVLELGSVTEHQNSMLGSLFARKCMSAIDMTEQELEAAYRNFEIGLCLKVGQSECEDFISKNQSDVEKVPCPVKPKSAK